MRPLLDVTNLDIGRGGIPLVSGINLRLGAGDLVVVRGKNGSGKTTLLYTLAGWVRPLGGNITSSTPPVLSTAHLGLYEDFKASALFRAIDAVIPGDFDRSALALFDPKRRVKDWNGAHRRLLLSVLALRCGTSVVLLDEPYEGLDSDLVGQTHSLIRSARSRGMAIALTHHREVSRGDLSPTSEYTLGENLGALHSP